MLGKSEGIVLKTIRYSESSVITRIFTREFGELSFMVPGVRSTKNKSKGSLFQPLQFLELDIYYHPNKKLLKLKEFRPAYIYHSLYMDILKQSIALFTIEALSKCIHEHEVNTDLYDYVRKFLLETDLNEKQDVLAPQRLLLQFSHILGFAPLFPKNPETDLYFNLEAGAFEPMPGIDGLSLDKNTSGLLLQLMSSAAPKFRSNERQLLTDTLVSYFRVHIPGFSQMASLEVLKQILH